MDVGGGVRCWSVCIWGWAGAPFHRLQSSGEQTKGGSSAHFSGLVARWVESGVLADRWIGGHRVVLHLVVYLWSYVIWGTVARPSGRDGFHGPVFKYVCVLLSGRTGNGSPGR